MFDTICQERPNLGLNSVSEKYLDILWHILQMLTMIVKTSKH